MFEKRSKILFANNIIAALYAGYLIVYFLGANSSAGSSAEQVGAGIATLLVMPHIILMTLGAIFGWLGFFLRKVGFALAAAILFSVAAGMFLLYAMIVIPMIVLGFVGYSTQKKIANSTI